MPYSRNWTEWVAKLDLKTCLICRERHGKIYALNEFIDASPPLHPNCRCVIQWLKALAAGTATKNKRAGADFWLKNYGTLPDYYITANDAMQNGWVPLLGNLYRVLPGKMIFGGVYQNKNGHLPVAPGRVWYEADINYTEGHRGTDRILFSNDGLIFVTYDHYETFVEII